MLVTTRTLTINAAFFQEIKDDNVRLRELLCEADAALGKHRITLRPAAIVNVLRQLQDQLAMHFSLEERLGYFEDAIQAAPRLSAQADILRSQHEQLYMAIVELADDAERILYREPNAQALRVVACRFRSFHDQLTRHEEAENELIMHSLYIDLGSGD
jgi:iron-sulfur cluster repair protein YtfE (RIC family)